MSAKLTILASSLHVVQLGSQAIKHSFGVNVHGEIEALVGLLPETPTLLDHAREIHRSVKPTMLGDRLLDPRGHLPAVPHVDYGSAVFGTIAATGDGLQSGVESLLVCICKGQDCAAR